MSWKSTRPGWLCALSVAVAVGCGAGSMRGPNAAEALPEPPLRVEALAAVAASVCEAAESSDWIEQPQQHAALDANWEPTIHAVGFPDSPAVPARELTRLGQRLRIRLAGESWEGLCAKALPDFQWGRRYMLWIARTLDHEPVFRLDCAYRCRTSNDGVQWVLLQCREAPWDQAYAGVMGDNLAATVRLHERRSRHDRGSGNYAIVLAEHPTLGTVYELGWQKQIANGTGLRQCELRLYLLQDASKKWRVLGEGPEQSFCKIGNGRAATVSSEASVEWTTEADPPCRVLFEVEDRDYVWRTFDDPERELRPDIVTRWTMMLDGRSMRAVRY